MNIDIQEQIENLIKERKTKLAKIQIFKWLKIEGKSVQNKIKASNWLRRVGLTRDAFKMIAPKNWNFEKAKTDPELSKQFLWTARMMNLLGATRFALKIIRNSNLESFEDYLVAGNIYLTDYDYESALKCFEFACKKANAKEKKLYSFRMGLVGLADCLAGLKRYSEAINQLNQIQVSKDEGLLQGILFQAKGEYLAQKGEFKKSFDILNKAQQFFPYEEQSADRAFLYKWLGYVEANLGNITKSKEYFYKALQILCSGEYRPESWLECLYLMHQMNLLPQDQLIILFSYPDLPQQIRKRYSMPSSLSIWMPNSEYVLMPFRNEWIHNGKYHAGMSLSLLLLSHLIVVGDRGLPSQRVKPILWPDEFASFDQLTERLERLLARIKKEWAISTKTENGIIKIVEGDLSRFSVEVLQWRAPMSFYEKHNQFSAIEFGNYYGLQKSSAHEFLKTEVYKNRLTENKVQRSIQYVVLE